MAIGCPTASHSLNVVSWVPEGSKDLPVWKGRWNLDKSPKTVTCWKTCWVSFSLGWPRVVLSNIFFYTTWEDMGPWANFFPKCFQLSFSIQLVPESDHQIGPYVWLKSPDRWMTTPSTCHIYWPHTWEIPWCAFRWVGSNGVSPACWWLLPQDHQQCSVAYAMR